MIAGIFAAATCLSSVTASAQQYQLDFDSLQTDVSELSGGDIILQGGTSPQQTFGTADNAQLLPLAAVAACGNGVREEGEACDGGDIGSATCVSFGFRTGTVSCSGACSIVTSECSDPIISSSSSASSAGQVSSSPQESRSSVHTGGGQRDVPLIPSRQEEAQGGHSSSRRNAASGASSAEQHSQETSSAETSSAAASENSVANDGEAEGSAASSSLGFSGSIRLEPGHSSGIHGASPDEKSIATGSKALAVGGATIAEAGIMLRLGWMSRFTSIYASIPAYGSAGEAVAAMLPAMRPGSVPASLLMPFPFLRKRRRKNESTSASLS